MPVKIKGQQILVSLGPSEGLAMIEWVLNYSQAKDLWNDLDLALHEFEDGEDEKEEP